MRSMPGTLSGMTWNSGAGDMPAGTGRQLISTDAYPEPIIITDAEVRADETEMEAEKQERER